MTFNNWIDTFIEEKGIDTETVIEVDSENGTPNFIPVGSVVEQMKVEHKVTKAQIKDALVRIDFKNGDVMHFITFLAKKMAIDF